MNPYYAEVEAKRAAMAATPEGKFLAEIGLAHHKVDASAVRVAEHAVKRMEELQPFRELASKLLATVREVLPRLNQSVLVDYRTLNEGLTLAAMLMPEEFEREPNPVTISPQTEDL